MAIADYILINNTVYNLGGGQLYILRRAKYLRSKGYNVLIVVAENAGDFILKDSFEDFDIFWYPAIIRPMALLSKKEVEALIDNIVRELPCKYNGQIYVESTALTLGVWAERLAFRLKAKHILYCISEVESISKYLLIPGRRFFINKYNKGELIGCSSESIYKLFGKKLIPNNYVNVAFDDTELSPSCVPDISYIFDCDSYVISTVSRLDKSYIEPLIDSACKLARKYTSRRFMLLIGGGSKEKKRESYLRDYANKKSLNIINLDIKFTGYINTLGKDFFSQSDLFVGMGTASINAISQKCLTLNIDPLDNNLCSGFFGHDTKNFAYSESGTHYLIYDKLEEAYLMDEETRLKYCQEGESLFQNEYNIRRCFEKLDSFFDNASPVGSLEFLCYSKFYHIIIKVLWLIRKKMKGVCEYAILKISTKR